MLGAGSLLVACRSGEELGMTRFTLMLAAALVLSTVGVQATQQGQTALRGWRLMDNCSRQAQAAYPDFTADSNAKRDAKLKECLSTYSLPPRQPLAQPGSR
jgi:hypothetical protein